MSRPVKDIRRDQSHPGDDPAATGTHHPGHRGGPFVGRQEPAQSYDPDDQPHHDLERELYKHGGRVTHHDHYASGRRLTAHQRQALPKSSFALPGKGKGPKGAGAGSYPIPDKSHARNALARVSQHGTSAEKATVRAKVHKKFPGIGQK